MLFCTKKELPLFSETTPVWVRPAARDSRVKDPNPPGSGKEIAEGKGVRREAESEGSRMWEQTNHGQTSGLTNRNRIEGYLRLSDSDIGSLILNLCAAISGI